MFQNDKREDAKYNEDTQIFPVDLSAAESKDIQNIILVFSAKE